MKTEQFNIIADYFSKPGVDVVLLFGSQATGRVTQNSDVDLAVLFDEKSVADVEAILEMKLELEALLKLKVDLVVLNRAHCILMHQVFKKFLVVFNHAPRHFQKIFVHHVTEYSDLKRVRKVIEENLEKRRVYG